MHNLIREARLGASPARLFPLARSRHERVFAEFADTLMRLAPSKLSGQDAP